jgi:hypothetical protein
MIKQTVSQVKFIISIFFRKLQYQVVKSGRNKSLLVQQIVADLHLLPL